ncbi:RNA-directed DNA polymerase, eukaryota [Tanacetum coccineum]
MEKMDMFCIKKCWGNMAFDYVHSDAVGNSGGILCVWDPNSFYKESVTISDSFVMIRGVWRATGLKYMIIAVYAPHEMKGKYLLWDYLQCEIKRWDGETVVTGDFNEVRHKSERFGTMFYAHEAKVFNTFIADSGLVEVSLGGSKFTWCHKSGSKMSKLDRFLVSENLLNTSPNINAITLARYLSDHRPILLREISYDYGPIPFKVFHYWFDMNGFNNLVEVAWKEYPGNDSNAIRYFMGKLKFLKSKIREWNVTRRLADNLMQFKLIKDLENLDAAVDRGEGKDEISCNRVDIINKLNVISNNQILEVSQKSKIRWAVEGDENSKFFHGMLNKKRSLLNVRGVLVDGIWVDNPHEVKNEFFEHFSSRFQHPGTKDATIVMDFPNVLSGADRQKIEGDVTNDEIKKAVWDCGTDKAPGPDVFTFGFFRRYWDLIMVDVTNAVRYFFTHCDIPKGCNSSFITLIPENLNSKLVKDFRPISLIGCLYKIIAKIMANRLVCVIKSIVNEVQSAFIADRQILDGPFILNEVIQWCKLKKKHALIFKVDFEKAYDSVSPTKEFEFGKGLKQGDPLSPFLFILVMESLHLSFQRVVDAGLFQGINIGEGLVNISHMFYADDAIFVGQWCDRNISTHRCAAKQLGCLTLNVPFSYLGSIVGGCMTRQQAWSDIVDRVKKRLSKWKMQMLSIGGRESAENSSMVMSKMAIKPVGLTGNMFLSLKKPVGLAFQVIIAINRVYPRYWILALFFNKVAVKKKIRSLCKNHPFGLAKLLCTPFRKVEESLNMTFDETPPPSKTSPLVDDDLDEEEAIKVTETYKITLRMKL